MKRFKIMLMLAVALALCLAPHGASAEAMVYNHLGETLSDFTVTTYDGETFTLSDALAEKDMVLINLWATWCGPCRMEFPFMEEAYEEYKDRVEIIALSVEPNDTNEVLAAYVKENGMTFKVANEGDLGLGSTFAIVGIPTTLVIDRFGTIAYIGIGSQPSKSVFTRLFDAFVGDDYTESKILYDLPPALPTIDPLAEAELNAALNIEGGELSFHNSTDKFVWPMIVYEEDGRATLASTNAGMDNSTASVLTTVSINEGDVLAFDFYTSSEAACDLLTISIDGTVEKCFGGPHDWTKWGISLPAGEHEIAFSYSKDAHSDEGDDLAMIDNVRIVSGDEAASILAALPVYPTSDEIAMTIVNEDAREIVFDDPDGFMADSFASQSYWIVPSGEATLKLSVTADVDPELAFFYSNYDGEQTGLIIAFDEDGSGYTASTGIDTVDTTGYSYCNMYFYANAEAANQGDGYGVMLFADEENVNALVSMLADYDVVVTWRYADDTAPSTADIAEGRQIASEYTVYFVDQDENPVPGCIVNFCTDETCVPTIADENGVAVFTGEPYAYHLQVIKVPEGYDFDKTQEFYTEPEGGELTFIVTKK